MSLNPEDFQRLQASLLELKNENYSLSDQLRRQRNALGEAQAKITVFEKELASTQKVVAKSKKAQEVQILIKDNESLQLKLRCQEEEFRLQNQTLLEELTKLVTANEGLEAKICRINEASPDEVAAELREEIRALQSYQKQLEAEKKAAILKAEKATTKSGAIEETVLVDHPGQGVSFRKTTVSSSESALGETDEVVSEDNGDYWKSQCLELQEKVADYQGKLRKKQDSLLQIQQEKDSIQTDLNNKLDALKNEKDTDTFTLHEQNQRLQVQLNNGRSGFAEFKEKKAKEIEELMAKINTLSAKVQSSEKLEAESESLKSDLLQKEGENEQYRVEIAQLKQEVQDLFEKSNHGQQELAGLEAEMKTLRDQVDDAVKVGENRKKLLDEMAIVIQKKTDEYEEAQIKIKSLTSGLEDSRAENSSLEAAVAKSNETKEELRRQVESLESKINELEASIASIKSKCLQDVQAAKESSKDDLNILKAEHEIIMRDLKMQLEISNAQKVEFEESIEHLKQEIKDLIEERKIVDKKGQSLVKDMKKQLLAEQQRNDKLSEKMREFQFQSEPSSTLSDNFTETDRTSNSSWSIYSEKNNDHSPSPTPPDQTDSCHEDKNTLEKKVGGLLEEKLLLEQRLHMLENSAAAMADDLVRKSTIIQFYCMEGKQDHVKKEAPSTPVEKMRSVKKRLDLLVNPDQVEAQQKEEILRMQRMLEETLTKNMHLQQDLEHLSQEVVRLSKLVPM